VKKRIKIQVKEKEKKKKKLSVNKPKMNNLQKCLMLKFGK